MAHNINFEHLTSISRIEMDIARAISKLVLEGLLGDSDVLEDLQPALIELAALKESLRPQDDAELSEDTPTTSEEPESPPTPIGSSSQTPSEGSSSRIPISIVALDRVYRFLMDTSLDRSHPDAKMSDTLATLLGKDIREGSLIQIREERQCLDS